MRYSRQGRGKTRKRKNIAGPGRPSAKSSWPQWRQYSAVHTTQTSPHGSTWRFALVCQKQKYRYTCRITHWVRDLDYIFSRKIRRDGWKCEVGLGEIGWKYEEIRRVYRAKTILTGNVRLRWDWASNRTRITWNNRVSFQNCLEEVKLECCWRPKEKQILVIFIYETV